VSNTDEEDNVPLNQMHTSAAQEKVPSISRTLLGLGRPSLATSKRPPKHCGSIVKRAIFGTLMNRNTNVGPVHGFGNPTTQQHSNDGSSGGKCPSDARKVQPFYMGPTLGGSSRYPTSPTSREPDVDENNDISKGRHLKRFVKTKVGDNIQIGLHNLIAEVEGEVAMNYGNEEQVLENDEMTNNDGTDWKEAPCDGNVVMPGVFISNVGTSSANLRPRRRSRAS
jgi:hypothetical protein